MKYDISVRKCDLYVVKRALIVRDTFLILAYNSFLATRATLLFVLSLADRVDDSAAGRVGYLGRLENEERKKKRSGARESLRR